MPDKLNASLMVEIKLVNPVGKPDLLLSDEMKVILEWIIFTFLCQSIDIFGIVTNTLNIVCFLKQGFKDPINVSLLGLAVSDLGCLVTLIWTNICLTPAFRESDLPFDALEFQYLTSAWPHATFTRVSSWITALITLERCLCIIAPLKVRDIVTSRRVAVLIVGIFVILLASSAPLYVVNRLEMKYIPTRNRTILGIVSTENRVMVEQISFTINNVFIPFGSFCVIFVCTVMLVTKLRNTTRWRKKVATPGQSDNVSNRNQRVAKMVVMISSLFIACFVPVSFVFLAIIIEPEFSVNGKHINILIVCSGLCFVFESINSSVNIFIYYNMSRKYRLYFRQMFGLDTQLSSQESDL